VELENDETPAGSPGGSTAQIVPLANGTVTKVLGPGELEARRGGKSDPEWANR
jgi:hypothetical protein